VPALLFAVVYTGLDDQDQAFSWLEKAYEERFYRLAYLKVEALWDPFAPIPGSPTCFDVSASRRKLI
jgi:hypothetical protein